MKKNVRKQIEELADKIRRESNTKDISSLKKDARALYEKLVVIEYLELQLNEGQVADFEESLDSKSYREQNWFTEPKPVPEPENKEEIIEPVIEKIKDIVAQMPKESEKVEEILNEILPKGEYGKNDWEEISSHYKEIPVFERKDQVTSTQAPAKKDPETNRPKSLNESLSMGLNIGLNDRLAFIKHLFAGNSDDFTRVVSQINTFESVEEAKQFIEEQVMPDYENWKGKEEFAERFLSQVEKRFI